VRAASGKAHVKRGQGLKSEGDHRAATSSIFRASSPAVRTPFRFSSVLMILWNDQLGVVVEADAEFLAGGAAIGGFDPALRP